MLLHETAFDFVEPRLKRIWPEWNGLARYGVTELPPSVCLAFIEELRSTADRVHMSPGAPECYLNSGAYTQYEISREFERNPGRNSELAMLFEELSEWLENAMTRSPIISLLGI